MCARDHIDFNHPSCVQVKPSLINGGGTGLFATRDIGKGQPVVIYYGTKMTDQEIFDLYLSDRDQYERLAPYLRGTPNGFAIIGDKTTDNSVLHGVYVNDIALIGKVNLNSFQIYAATLKLCNLKVVETLDYPVYFATRRIKKGEELYVHYGIGYWLQYLGLSADQISDYNQIYHFDTLY